jgi:hypothetical protein
MDVNAAFRAMIHAFVRGEWDDATEAFDNIRGWMIGGGFAPVAWNEPSAVYARRVIALRRDMERIGDRQMTVAPAGQGYIGVTVRNYAGVILGSRIMSPEEAHLISAELSIEANKIRPIR